MALEIINQERFTSRLNHLLQTGAFSTIPNTRGIPHAVGRMLRRWEESRIHSIDRISTITRYVDLKADRTQRILHEYDDSAIPSFEFIPSSPEGYHHSLRDSNGTILAYRFRYPTNHLTMLYDTQPLLPNPISDSTVRGIFSKRHYALWADYSPDIRQSSQYRDDLPQAEEWLLHNGPLFDYLSHNLRMIHPEMYVKFTSIDGFLPDNLNRMAGAWHGLAVNQGMEPGTARTATHIDWLDYMRGFNAVVPWGNYEGGNLILLQAQVVYELRPGDCLFFRGGIMAHKVSDVTDGVRHSLDLFCHKSTFDWLRRQ